VISEIHAAARGAWSGHLGYGKELKEEVHLRAARQWFMIGQEAHSGMSQQSDHVYDG
jgi:hypothetical protein